ncbi:50S ribosomal protein L11 methyltransferase [Dactylosporangium sp. NPDC005572]|uniref:class I SAM-dependent methyltransferase n=1 Tax=Dactylosporangium sp. NPDC005572 TaxID=3156889 RepID=UPI0033A7334F
MVPEVTLDLAGEEVGLYEATGGYRSDSPPPFWSFAWPGGIALARFVLDRPELVAGRTVVDLGAGSGLVAIAAARAGAAAVTAVDSDPAALAAAGRNAALNGVTISTAPAVVPADVLLAGDLFYSPTVVAGVLPVLRAGTGTVLVGDPGRGYLPERLFEPLATYDVPVRPALESTGRMRTTVWRLLRATSSC